MPDLEASTMRIVEVVSPGGPDALRLAVGPVPSIGPKEVLVKVAFAGVNGPDLMQRKGLYPPPPGASPLLGLEVAGEVAAVGKEVRRWKVGDPLCALVNGGGYAEYCAVLADHCLPVPNGLTLAEAASLPEVYCTIWSNVFMTAQLGAGETFLVHGGAGGLGTAAIQLGKAFGARVVVTDSPGSRIAECKALGADRVIDYREEDFVDVVRREFGGANVILDIVGGPYIQRNLKAALHDCRIIQLAFAMGSKVELDFMPIMLKRIHYTGSTLRSRSDDFKTEVARQLEKNVWPHFETGRLKPVVNAMMPLAAAADAHRLMESGAHCGKIVLQA